MFTKLTITNFRAIKGTITFPLTGRGLILLNGDHKCDYGDSNGAGKSSIYLAILWCLFGHTGEQTANDIVNKHSPFCEVELEFRKNSHTYTVLRKRSNAGRGSTTLCFTEDNSPRENKGKSVADIEHDVSQVLGVTKDAFMFTLISDGDSNFAQLKDEKQKQLLEALLDFDVSKYRGSTSSRALEITNRLREIEIALQVGNRTSAVSEETLTLAKDRVTKALLNRDQQNSSPELQQYEQRSMQLREEIARIEMGFADSIRVERDNIQRCLQMHNWLQGKEKELIATIVSVTDANAALALADKTYQDACAKATCDKCGRDHTAESKAYYYTEATTTWNRQRKQIEADIIKAETARSHIILELQNSGCTGEVVLQDLYQHWQNKTAEHKTRLAAIESTRLQQTASLQEQLTQVNTAVGTIRERKAQAVREVEAATTALRQLEVMRENHAKQVNLTSLTTEKSSLALEMTVLENVEAAFRKNGLPSYIIETQLTFIEYIANQYLKHLSPSSLSILLRIAHDGKKQDGNLIVEAVNDEGATTYGGLSKGEKERINIAMMLALRKLVIDNHCDPGILFLDELVDGLDHTGIENIVGFLKELAEDTQIICISHNQETVSYFSDIITIRRAKNIDAVLDTSQLIHYGA